MAIIVNYGVLSMFTCLFCRHGSQVVYGMVDPGHKVFYSKCRLLLTLNRLKWP